MKQFSIISLFSLLLVLVACGGPEGEKVASAEAQAEGANTMASSSYMVNAAASTINWEGSKLVGGGHVGTINILDGQLIVADNKIVGGKFAIDMASLNNSDLEGDMKGKLEGHLKSDDFFSVESYPTASFVITSLEAVEGKPDITHHITGNLTMRDSTRSITIPAMVAMDGNTIKATSTNFVIDRTEWGVRYGSGTVAGIAQDNIINDNVGLKISLVASK